MNHDILWALVLLIVGIVLYQFTRSDPRETYAPPLIVAAVFFVYSVVAPLNAQHSGETMVFFLNALPHYPLVWGMVLLHLVGWLIGYHLISRFLPPLHPSQVVIRFDLLARFGYKICVGSVLLYLLANGFDFLLLLNAFEARELLEDRTSRSIFSLGVLTKYFAYSINFLVIGILFQLPAALKFRFFRWRLLSWFGFAIALYVGFGFRWRIAILWASLMITWHLFFRKRMSILLLVSFFVSLLVLGAMGINRVYGGGLDVNALSSVDLNELLKPNLNEARNVFNMTALVLADVQYRDDYVGLLVPLKAAIYTFIPRYFLPSKDIASYLKDEFVNVFGDPIAAQAGLAVLNIGEYYLILGWVGVFAGGLILGTIYSRIWRWFLLNSENPLTMCLYVISISFTYIIISRGFTPGVLILAGFTFLPFLIFRRRLESMLAGQNSITNLP